MHTRQRKFLSEHLRDLIEWISRYLAACADPRQHVPKNTDDETLREYLKERERFRKSGPV